MKPVPVASAQSTNGGSEPTITRVTHFVRRTPQGFFSIEQLYHDIRASLTPDIQVQVCVNKFLSRGLFARAYDAVRASAHQSDVNHVTGDVHFLSYFLGRRRTVITMHDCIGLQNARGLRWWLLWFFWYWLPSQRCAVIVTVSEVTKVSLQRHLPGGGGKIRVIHNPVSAAYKPSPKPFEARSPRILIVGTTANKNIERTMQALEGIPCKAVIIGRLSDTQLGAIARFRINVEHHVDLSREELVSEYERCDLLSFMSTYEGFGLPIIEAQATGRPVVTSNTASMPEVAGDAACLVDPHSVASMRQGIVRVIEDATYRENLVERGFENVKRFRIEVIASRYAELYREIAAANGMRKTELQ